MVKISNLRQWLNEDRIPKKKLVTNSEIKFMLGLIDKKEFKKERAKEVKQDEKIKEDLCKTLEQI